MHRSCAALFGAAMLALTSARVDAAHAADGAADVVTDQATNPAAGSANGQALPQSYAARPFGMVLNGQNAPEPCLVAMMGRSLLLRSADLEALGITPPAASAGLQIEGESFTRADAVPGLSARVDESRAILYLEADPASFPAIRLGAPHRRLPQAEAVPAAFIDYDVSVYDWNGDLSATALLDAGLSGRWGVFGNTFVIQPGQQGLTRLATTFQRDFIERGLRLVIGDGVTRGAAWSQPVRFAGLRIGTDFALDPGEITFPLPSLSGSAAVPSTIDLLSAGVTQSYATGPGRFAIDFMPRFTGAGQVSMTIRDAAGNARHVTRRFYATPNLLRPGLDAWSVEVGALRKDYGLRSFAYGSPFAGAVWRRGITPQLTLESRIEASLTSAAQGLAANFAIPELGEFGMAAAASQGPLGDGYLYKTSFQRRTSTYSIAVNYEHADAAFRQVGDDRPAQGARSDLTFAGSMDMGRAGNFSLGYLTSRRGDDRVSIGSLAWSASLNPAFVSFGAERTMGAGKGNTTLFASLTIPLGRRAATSFTVDRNRAAVAFNQAAPPQGGFGYRLLAGHDLATNDLGSGAGVDNGNQWLEAGATLQGQAGTLDFQAVSHAGQTGLRLSAHGALVAAGGRIVATPRLDYGLALVELMSDATVTVLVENRPTAQRIGNGRRAIITGLTPYGANRIAIDPGELPINQALTQYETTVAPGWRQVARVGFGGAAPAHPLRLHLRDAQGAELATGRDVTLPDGSKTIVGNGGEVFLENASGGDVIAIGGTTPCMVRLPRSLPANSLDTPHNMACLAASEKE